MEFLKCLEWIECSESSDSQESLKPVEFLESLESLELREPLYFRAVNSRDFEDSSNSGDCRQSRRSKYGTSLRV